MVGRLDDHLKRIAEREHVSITPGWLDWAGIAVFKRAAATFRARGYRATPLAAAYRHHLHWSELIGPGVVLSMPYRWWTQFEASDVEPAATLARPVDPQIITALETHCADFRRAFMPDGLEPAAFASWGPSVHTLQQFMGGWQQLVDIVRGRMLR
jgi:transaldolase